MQQVPNKTERLTASLPLRVEESEEERGREGGLCVSTRVQLKCFFSGFETLSKGGRHGERKWRFGGGGGPVQSRVIVPQSQKEV